MQEPTEKADPAVDSPIGLAVLNTGKLTTYTDSDPEFAERLLGIVRKDLPKQFARTESSLLGGSCDEAFRAAHSLKTSAAWIGAEQLEDVAMKIERLAHNEAFPEAQLLLDELRACYGRLTLALDAVPSPPQDSPPAAAGT